MGRELLLTILSSTTDTLILVPKKLWGRCIRTPLTPLPHPRHHRHGRKKQPPKSVLNTTYRILLHSSRLIRLNLAPLPPLLTTTANVPVASSAMP